MSETPEFEPSQSRPAPIRPASSRKNSDAIGRASKFMMIAGAILTAIGMIFGMGSMLLGFTESAVMDLIMIVPGGFLMCFAGLTGWVLAGGK